MAFERKAEALVSNKTRFIIQNIFSYAYMNEIGIIIKTFYKASQQSKLNLVD